MNRKSTLEKLIYWFYCILLFFIPLSLQLEIQGTGAQLMFMTEPLCIILIGLSAIHLLRGHWKKIHLTMLDKVVAAHFVFLFLSSYFSDDLLVSGKYMITLFWYVIAGYAIPRLLLIKREEIIRSLMFYISGVFVLSLWVLYNFARLGIFYESSYEVGKPFIPVGHTNMSVVIEPALLIVAGLFFMTKRNLRTRIIMGSLFTIFMAVIIFSCSKASYFVVFVSLFLLIFGMYKRYFLRNIKGVLIVCAGLFVMGYIFYSGYLSYFFTAIHFAEYSVHYFIGFSIAFIVFLFFKRKKRYAQALMYIYIPITLVLGIWYVNDYFHQKKFAASDKSYYAQGSKFYDPTDPSTYKPTNMISELTDKTKEVEDNTSNLERLNRWKIGLDMYTYRPVLGLGMGTFSDKYLYYLTNNNEMITETELTQIRMNIHNLYLTWLVEGGVFTFISGLILFIIIVRAILLYFFSSKFSYLKLTIFIFFTAYFIHGLAHDFSQDPRVIILFWSVMALMNHFGFSHPKKLKKSTR